LHASSAINRLAVAVLGLRLAEAKQLTAALQAEMVPAQVTMVGERRRLCVACGCVLASKGHYPATFRSLFGDVPVRVRRRLACPFQGSGGAKSFAVRFQGLRMQNPTRLFSSRLISLMQACAVEGGH
jgi:hypothetical protein